MKYMGSKTRIAKHILPIILKNRKENQFYVEPFVGGANIIDKVTGNRIGADLNSFLIAALEKIRDEPQELPESHKEASREFYYDVKTDKEHYSKWIVGYFGFALSYGGKWFGGYAGKRRNGNRDDIQEAHKNAQKQSSMLRGIDFKHSSYLDLDIPAESIIYCDPPYEGTTGYKDSFNHNEFWNWCRFMGSNGHTVFVSEYNAPEDFECVWEKEVKCTMSSKTALNSVEKMFKI